ncbi:MAG: TIGR03663 family protein [Ignavibacteriae bacterium]|nr:TIGR03663 family protein [Ignavibacteriota bacterium]
MIVIFFALFLRLYDLNNRPFHTDEAVHAIKFGELLESGKYIYDPIEYHGPTLNYFSLIPAYIFNEKKISEVNEITLRIVPAFTSIILIIFLFSILNAQNKIIVLFSASLISISPIYVFYSRYYIQESMLVSFTFSSIISFYKYFKLKKLYWGIFASLFCALIFATKETSIIIFFAGIFSFLFIYLSNRDLKSKFSFNIIHIILFFIIFISVTILFYSSFFTNPNGIFDSLKTFTNYFSKAGSNSDHIQQWDYYLNFLLFTKNDLITFTELPLFIFFIVGIIFQFKKNKHNVFLNYIILFSIIQAIIYFIIPYKTPWLALNFWIGFLLIAAFGICSLYKLLPRKNLKIFFSIFIVIILSHNFYQTYLTNFKFPYQPENPFTYSQPTPEIVSASKKIIDVIESDSSDQNIYVNIISHNNDYWPLPWYLRKIKNVAWNETIPNNINLFQVIIITPELENELIEKLYTLPEPGKINLYIPIFDNYTSLRPNIEIRGFVQNSLNDKYLRNQNKVQIENLK